jgi:hypothetical protein
MKKGLQSQTKAVSFAGLTLRIPPYLTALFAVPDSK